MARDMKDIPSEEKKLEQYGVWVKVEPEEYGAAEPAGEGELMDLESPAEEAGATITAAPAEESFTKEEEELLDELETEIGQDDASAPESGNLADLEEASPAQFVEAGSAEEGEVLPELDLDDIGVPAVAEEAAEPAETPVLHDQDVLELPDDAFPVSDEAQAVEEALPAEIPPAEEEALGEIDVPLSEESPKEEHFDDLAALEEELATVEAASTETGKSGAAVSGEILSRIEAELKSIRSDLSELKKELTVLKRPSTAPVEAKETEAGGFFEEDEDETIALTGDELDNILSTAEITEGQAAAGEHGEEASAVENPSEAAEEVLDELPETLTLEESPAPTEPVSELELESLGIEGQAAEQTEAPSIGDELELEPLAVAEEAEAPAEAEEIDMELESLPEAESQEADTEPLELEPVEEASAEEAPMDLEAIPEFEPVEQGPAAEAEDEIELEALSPEEEGAAGEPADAIELEELSAEAPESGENGIEIAFEDGGEKPEEEVAEAEEVSEAEEAPRASSRSAGVPDDLKNEIRTVLKYMDQLLEALPEEKIQEFASSEYFVMYKKLFEDLGLGE